MIPSQPGVYAIFIHHITSDFPLCFYVGISTTDVRSRLKKMNMKGRGKSLTNFTKVLPGPHSSLAQETLKDPYNFDFLGLEDCRRRFSSISKFPDIGH